MSKKADLERIKYVRETNVHHLFELLASRVLSKRPADIYSFLREQIDDIERIEKGAKHDPSQLPSRAAAHAPAAPSAPSTSSPAPAATPAVAVSAQKGPIKVTLAVFGLDNAGKTALIASVGGAPDDKTTPTVGFSPVMFETDKYDVCMFDLGGAATFRGIWPHYFHDLHGVVFVVDGSDAVRVAEAAKVLDEVLQHPYLRTKPLTVFVNKKDKAGYMGADAVAAKLNLSTLSDRYHMPLRVASCCAVQLDDGIDEAMDWLLTTVAERYESLAAVVKAHTAEVREEKKKRLEEQARRVEAAKLAEEQAAVAAAGSA